MGNCSCFGSTDRAPSDPKDNNFCHEFLQAARYDGILSGEIIFPRGNFVRFSYDELAKATDNFRHELLNGKRGFGPVFKGQLQTTGQIVAVKQFDRYGPFIMEADILGGVSHSNIINFIGYCSEAEHRFVVHELEPLGSLHSRLHDLKPEMQPLDWNTRMKIAAGVAKALNYLHTEAVESVIYKKLASSNILLGQGFHPKLSDFGGSRHNLNGGRQCCVGVFKRSIETHGLCAPEYIKDGRVTTSMDVYSYGVLLLELITGLEPFTQTRGQGKQLLTEWVCANFSPKEYDILVDPVLKGKFPKQMLRVVLEMAFLCVAWDPMKRPPMSEVVQAMDRLTPHDPNAYEDMDSGETTMDCFTLCDPNAHPNAFDIENDKRERSFTVELV